MNTSSIKKMLRKGFGGTFRPLKPREIIDAGDIVVNDTWIESPSETSIGQPCNEKDRIIRLAFYEKGTGHL